jgi:16S rRNA (uracil1498-N3)-methyltransferase
VHCTGPLFSGSFFRKNSEKTTEAWVGTEGAPPIEQRARDLLNSLKDENNSNVVDQPRHGVLIIGPEGDFTAEELELMAAAGVHGVGLGPLRLRTETAAIAMLSYARFAVTI